MSKELIVVDAGNTNVQFALAKGLAITRRMCLPSSGITRLKISKTLKRYPKAEVILCSVVPRISKLFKGRSSPVIIAGKDILIPVTCRYNKKGIGPDRLVGAFAAKKLYPRTRMIIDFGTAITFDFLSTKGVYQGGLILPGIGSTLRVLSSCAMIPDHISLKKTKALIPKNTPASISKGIDQGFSAMINSLVKTYQKRIKGLSGTPVLITGGESSFIRPGLKFSYVFDPDLVLKGLSLLKG